MDTKVTTRVEVITPDLAKLYLLQNGGNRRLSQTIIDSYARSMKNGEWLLSNDAISFDENGLLLNGQHRLHAVCKSEVPCEFLVVRNLQRGTFGIMDNGKSRSVSDVLYIRGIKRNTIVGAVVRRKMVLDRGLTAMTKYGGGGSVASHPGLKLINSDIIPEYEKHKSQYDEVSAWAALWYDRCRILKCGDYGGYSSYLILSMNHPMEVVKSFFDEFAGVKPTTNIVIDKLRERLLNDKLSSVKMIGSKKQKLIIKTWNAYVTGKTYSILSYSEKTEGDIWFI